MHDCICRSYLLLPAEEDDLDVVVGGASEELAGVLLLDPAIVSVPTAPVELSWLPTS